MSDINEEQKRLYKRAEENDIKLLRKENKKLKDLCDKYEEEHNNEFQCWKRDRKELLDKRYRINKAYKILDEITFYTTPIGQVVHLDMIISDIKKVKNILKGSDKE